MYDTHRGGDVFYSYPCSYCEKVFYTYNDSREYAARTLFYGIKQHLIDYDEDRKEYDFDDLPETDIDKIYYAMAETNYEPSGGYELE